MPKKVQQDHTITEDDLKFTVINGTVYSFDQMNRAKRDKDGNRLIPECKTEGREELRKIAQQKYDNKKRGKKKVRMGQTIPEVRE